MADSLRAEGKIYVVVAIILIILAGPDFLPFLMDRKVNKLEKSDFREEKPNQINITFVFQIKFLVFLSICT